MATAVEWEWLTDSLRWKAYNPACSAAIEAAHQAGVSSVNLGVESPTPPTHCITFQQQTPCQVAFLGSTDLVSIVCTVQNECVGSSVISKCFAAR